MYATLTTEEVPVLTQQETAMLLALASSKGGETGWEIARRCEEDSGGQIMMPNSTTYTVLRRLERAGLIMGNQSQIARRGARTRVYGLTEKGTMILEWQLDTYSRMVRLGRERLSRKRVSAINQNTR